MKNFLLHLLNATINGAAGGVLMTAGNSVMGQGTNFKQLGIAAASGAIIGTVRHLQQSPLIVDSPDNLVNINK